MRTSSLFLLGTIGFIAISYFEQAPILGWLGSLVSVVAWITLARAVAEDGGSAIVAAVLGAWTGFVGAVSAWALQTGNLIGLDVGGFERVGAGFGFVGATLGLFYWPLIGTAICIAAAVVRPQRRLASGG